MAEAPGMSIAELDNDGLSKVQVLEEDIGGYVLALEPRVTLKELSSDQLAKFRAAEEELGVVLMAYEGK